MKALESLWTLLREAFAPARTRRSQKYKSRSQSTPLRLELLEQRRLLSTNQIQFDTEEAQITIAGSEGADEVVVSSVTADLIQVVLKSNGEVQKASFQKSDVSSIKFVGAGGDDRFINQTDLRSFAWGGAGDDVLIGGTGNDELYGGDGNDNLYGGNGNDRLEGGAGDDGLLGDDGNDRLDGGDGNDLLYGLEGDDQLIGGAGDDKLFGGAGDDKLFGGAGNDHLVGEEGDDRLDGGEGNDLLYGLDGDDKLFGRAGDDKLFGGAGDDGLLGEEGNDRLDGGEGNDLLYGLEGDDQLIGGAGDDKLFGGAGDDGLVGEEGNDLLDGGVGDDRLFGGAGDDVLLGEDGNDWLDGEEGNDLLLGGAGNDQLFGGEGNDVLVGHAGDDKLYAIAGDNVLIGGEGQDNLVGAAGGDLLIGGSTIYDSDSEKLRALLQQWTVNAPYANRIAAIEAETSSVHLESGHTVLHDNVSDTILGGDGADWFFLTGSMPIYSPLSSEHDTDHGGSHSHPIEVIHTLPELEGFELISSLDVLRDLNAAEALHSKVPHARDLTLQREHLSLFELVRYDQVTHFAVGDGNWSNPATWHNGVVPGAGARVLIPYGVHVNVDHIFKTRLATVRVDGTLSFATQNDSELRADTVVVSASGVFEMGTQSNPIAPNATARLLIIDSGPINRAWDPYGISRGLIAHGRTMIHGQQVTGHSAVQGVITAGTTLLTLADVPLGWKVGDEIVIAGTVAGAQQDEVRQIVAIQGRVILVAPLTYDHLTPNPSFEVHVAHLTRNAVIESESTAIDRRGHVMFMHSRDVDIQYAGFYRLGRTNKLEVVNDPVVDADWALQAGTGTNPRGRYAVHFHRNGVANDGNPAVVHGSVVMDSPGWGYVNHSSYVEFTNNVAFDVDGAAFVTEAGDEIGSFRQNIAIHTIGSGEQIESRMLEQDFGHQGDGFWFQGAGITVTDNVSAGNSGNAFVIYSRGLREGSQTREFQSDNLADPSIANGAPTIKVEFVAMREFTRNEAFASSVGLTTAYNLRDAPHQQQSEFSDSNFWNNSKGIDLSYSHSVVLRNLKIVHDSRSMPQTGVGHNVVTRDIVYENLTVTGYAHGIEVPRRGYAIISGGYYNNLESIVVITALSANRSVLIKGPIIFGTLPADTVGTRRQYEVVTRSIYTPVLSSIAFAFVSDTIVLDYGPFANRRIYYFEQNRDAVPFSSVNEIIPEEYVGLTTQQLRNKYGWTIGGELAPVTAYSTQTIRGLVAP